MGDVFMENEKKVNILLVDDRPENLFTLEEIIGRSDFNLVKATSGEEALKYLLNDDFATILLDVQMPGMDGFDTAKIIKSREKTKNIPILFITANNMESEHIFKGYSLGAIDYILKPFDPIILKAKVEGFVEIYKMKQRLIAQSNELQEKNQVIEHLAYHDGLTNLPNRRYFQELLIQTVNKAKKHKQTFGLMYVDLDRFKYINDSLGHIMGDRLLQEVSKRLLSVVREQDIVARVGGDEFNILLPETDREHVLEVAEHILFALKEAFTIEQYELFVTACIGLSMFPYDGEDIYSLLRNADAALYRAKEQGKNTYKVYHTGMNLYSYRTFLLQNDLRKAVENDELFLVYQPIVNIETARVSKLEALVRWNHPSWGLISPAEFIPLAEETGQIGQIGNWVLKEVCHQLNMWKEKELNPIKIGVNLSAQQFLQKDLVAEIEEILVTNNVPPNLIEIEVTETAIILNDKVTNKCLHQLREMGIKISLDDFGTGYSSINYLRQFPFDTIKIDKSFIQGLVSNKDEAVALIDLLYTLAMKLNMKVVFEGIEEEDQLDYLRKYSAEDYQGYLFSPPLAAEKVEKFLYQSNKNASIPSEARNKEQEVLTENLVVPQEKGLKHEIIDLAVNYLKEEYSISSKEKDVFKLLIEGKSNMEISEELAISEYAVKDEISKTLQKLNVTDRVQAMAILYEYVCMK